MDNTGQQQTTEQAVTKGVLNALGIVAAVLLVVAILGWMAWMFLSADDGISCETENLQRSSDGLPAKDC